MMEEDHIEDISIEAFYDDDGGPINTRRGVIWTFLLDPDGIVVDFI